MNGKVGGPAALGKKGRGGGAYWLLIAFRGLVMKAEAEGRARKLLPLARGSRAWMSLGTSFWA